MCSCSSWCFAAVVPYHYALGNEFFSNTALQSPEYINETILAQFTRNHASDGLIDSPRNMLEDRVFIYNCANDTVIHSGHTPLIIYNTLSVFLCIVNKNLNDARPAENMLSWQ